MGSFTPRVIAGKRIKAGIVLQAEIEGQGCADGLSGVAVRGRGVYANVLFATTKTRPTCLLKDV